MLPAGPGKGATLPKGGRALRLDGRRAQTAGAEVCAAAFVKIPMRKRLACGG